MASRYCDNITRRDSLQVGALGLSGLTMAQWSAARIGERCCE